MAPRGSRPGGCKDSGSLRAACVPRSDRRGSGSWVRTGSSRVSCRTNPRACLGADRTAGGHSAAAGFTVQLARWEEFSQAVSDLILKHPGDIEGVEVYLDAFFESNENLPKVLEEIAHLDPYGQGFPVPSFSICRFQEKQRTQVFGDNHLRINLGSAREPLEAVGFSLGEWAEEIEKHPVDIAIEYAENTWNGKTSLRPKILAIRPSLRETTEPAGAGEVARLETEGPLSKVVVWDARGLCPSRMSTFSG
ncbi:MAG: hypothetical protein IPI28_13630 [Candidatus Omnitrophica bacterium]|nr:hypothetical protein [Candidatus Omnitrophota bacterium]